MTRKMKLILAAFAAVFATVSAAAPAMASQAPAPRTSHTAWEWFVLTSSSDSSLPVYDAVGYGAFAGGGTFATLAESSSETALEGWVGGYAFWVNARHDGTSSESVSPATCKAVFTATGSYLLYGARLHGWGNYTLTSHAVLPRLKNKACDLSGSPVPGSVSTVIDAQGPVTINP